MPPVPDPRHADVMAKIIAKVDPNRQLEPTALAEAILREWEPPVNFGALVGARRIFLRASTEVDRDEAWDTFVAAAAILADSLINWQD